MKWGLDRRHPGRSVAERGGGGGLLLVPRSGFSLPATRAAFRGLGKAEQVGGLAQDAALLGGSCLHWNKRERAGSSGKKWLRVFGEREGERQLRHPNSK